MGEATLQLISMALTAPIILFGVAVLVETASDHLRGADGL